VAWMNSSRSKSARPRLAPLNKVNKGGRNAQR
jgi:hypothetical protein